LCLIGLFLFFLFFFFSSRRRHTRFDCDWSSDVCSSDLVGFQSSKARALLNWKPTLSFQELVRVMVEADLKAEGLEPQEVMSRTRSEERRVGKECRCRWATEQSIERERI